MKFMFLYTKEKRFSEAQKKHQRSSRTTDEFKKTSKKQMTLT